MTGRKRASSWAGLGPDVVLACLAEQLGRIASTARRLLGVPGGLDGLGAWYAEVRQAQRDVVARLGIDPRVVDAFGVLSDPEGHVSPEVLALYVAGDPRVSLPWCTGDPVADLAYVAEARTEWVPTVATLAAMRRELLTEVDGHG